MLLYPMARLVILISAVPRNLLGVQFQHQIPALVAAEILVWRNNLERSTNKKLYFFCHDLHWKHKQIYRIFWNVLWDIQLFDDSNFSETNWLRKYM